MMEIKTKYLRLSSFCDIYVSIKLQGYHDNKNKVVSSRFSKIIEQCTCIFKKGIQKPAYIFSSYLVYLVTVEWFNLINLLVVTSPDILENSKLVQLYECFQNRAVVLVHKYLTA
jgi:hypothetical protein